MFVEPVPLCPTSSHWRFEAKAGERASAHEVCCHDTAAARGEAMPTRPRRDDSDARRTGGDRRHGHGRGAEPLPGPRSEVRSPKLRCVCVSSHGAVVWSSIGSKSPEHVVKSIGSATEDSSKSISALRQLNSKFASTRCATHTFRREKALARNVPLRHIAALGAKSATGKPGRQRCHVPLVHLGCVVTQTWRLRQPLAHVRHR